MTSSHAVYLRRDVVLEPLINGWYASTYLIPPVTAALYVANHHIKVMQSFVASPAVHEEAVKNPEMRGGPFIAHPASRVDGVCRLLERTRAEQADLLELAPVVRQLDELLALEGTGGSLEPLYAKVPALLRGYVELVYDLHHRPYFRVLEPLLYESRFYRTSNQTIALSTNDKDDRAFALSTPRLEGDGSLDVALPFASPALDELARARRTPKPLEHFADRLRTKAESLAPYFTDRPPREPAPYSGEGVSVRYLGHACVLVQSKRASIMFDPLVPYEVSDGMARFSFADLPERIDWVVLTHNHQDHVVLETLLQLRHKIGAIVVPGNNPGNPADPSLKLLFRKLGFAHVVALDEMESVEIDGGSITALPFFGEHGDLDVRSKAAHLLKIEGRSIVCAADSNNLEPELYRHITDMVGPIDTVFLGMECQGAPMSWVYGPLLAKPIARKHDQWRRLDGSDSAKALDVVRHLKPSRVYVYAMGAEPWLQFITSIRYTDASKPIVESNRFVDECRRAGVEAERLYGARDIALG